MSCVILKNELRAGLRYFWELIAIAALSLPLALFIYIAPENPAIFIFSLPFILFFTGYTLTVTLLPKKTSLANIERIALSFALSVVVTSLISFGLNYTPFDITLEPMLWSLIAFNIIFSILGIWRRSTTSEPFLPFEPKAPWIRLSKGFQEETKTGKALTIILTIAIISSVFSLAYVIAIPREGGQFTEFYILGPGGKVSDYPNNLTVGEPGEVIIGIANHEQRSVNYTIEVWLVNATYANNVTAINELYFVENISVGVLDSVTADTEGDWTKQWEQYYNITVPFTGQYKIWFVLLKDGQAYGRDSMTDLAGDATTVEAFLSRISSKDYLTLNLNLQVT